MPKRAGQQAQERPVSTLELTLTGTPRHGEVEVAVKATRVTRVRSRLAFLAGRDNASEPISLLLIQQGVLAETGIASGDIYSIEKKHEADHEDNGKQRKGMGHQFAHFL